MTNDTLLDKLNIHLWSTKIASDNDNPKTGRFSVVYGYILLTLTVFVLLMMYLSFKNCCKIISKRHRLRETLDHGAKERRLLRSRNTSMTKKNTRSTRNHRRHTWASFTTHERTEEVFL